MNRLLKAIAKRVPGFRSLDRALRRRYTGTDRPEPALRGSWGSPLPGYEDIRDRAHELFRKDVTFGPDICLREAEQQTLFRELARLVGDFDWPERPTPGRRYYTDNGWFARSDAMVLYGILRFFRPGRVMEVGSGYSSALLLDATERIPGLTTRLEFIDPEPQRLFGVMRDGDRARAVLTVRPVQQVAPARFTELGAGDVLFIDSSHVSKIGSDLNYLLFEAVPRVGSGCLVHIHDIFWPFEYPREWVEQGRAWNEAYVVRAFLQFNSAFEILLFNNFLQERHAAELRGFLPRFFQGPACSMWLRRI